MDVYMSVRRAKRSVSVAAHARIHSERAPWMTVHAERSAPHRKDVVNERSAREA
jgi:hypothetical protein